MVLTWSWGGAREGGKGGGALGGEGGPSVTPMDGGGVKGVRRGGGHRGTVSPPEMFPP